MSEADVVIVNEQKENVEMSDVAEEEVRNMKMTANLLKQISFNTTVNRFEYLEELLHTRYDQFVQKMSVAITSQKEVLKKVKAIHHDVKELKVPQINFGKIHLQVQEMNKVQKEAQKYFKLSQGMLNAAFKLEAVLDEHLAQTNTH